MIAYLLTGIGALVALPFILAFFIKKQYAVAREIVINKPNDEIYNYIRFIKNQDNFSKWNMMDPEMKKEFKGTDGTVGFVYAWDGDNKAGKGEQEIKGLSEGKRVETEVRFIKPIVGIAQAYFETTPLSEDRTTVKWGMVGSNTYPRNFVNLFMDKMLGKDLETSLSNLKDLLENR